MHHFPWLLLPASFAPLRIVLYLTQMLDHTALTLLQQLPTTPTELSVVQATVSIIIIHEIQNYVLLTALLHYLHLFSAVRLNTYVFQLQLSRCQYFAKKDVCSINVYSPDSSVQTLIHNTSCLSACSCLSYSVILSWQVSLHLCSLDKKIYLVNYYNKLYL